MSSQRRVNEAYDQRTLAPTNLCSIDTQRGRRLLNNIEISEEHKKLLEKNQLEISILSPSGRKFRSKPQLAHYQGDSVDLTAYDYQSGKVNSLLLRKNKNQRDTQFEYSRGVRNDASLVPPIRQTASIFKQPVTVYKTQEGKVKTDFKHGPQEKPKQLFWEKRLEGLRACDIDGEEFNPMELPKGLKTVGPHVGEETTYQSIATALHVSSQPVTGQTGSKTSLEKNPGVFLNPEQPLIQAVTIADEDIRRQEERVQLVRRKLQEALKA